MTPKTSDGFKPNIELSVMKQHDRATNENHGSHRDRMIGAAGGTAW
jgi:hypothetical protein